MLHHVDMATERLVNEHRLPVLLRADPTAHAEITRFPAIEGKTWNHRR